MKEQPERRELCSGEFLLHVLCVLLAGCALPSTCPGTLDPRMKRHTHISLFLKCLGTQRLGTSKPSPATSDPTGEVASGHSPKTSHVWLTFSLATPLFHPSSQYSWWLHISPHPPRVLACRTLRVPPWLPLPNHLRLASLAIHQKTTGDKDM